MVMRGTLVPVAAGLLGALVFALARPGLTDVYDAGFSGRLHWGATGLVVWGLFTALTLRRPWADATPREKVGTVAVALTAPVLTWLLLSNPADVDRVASTIWTVLLAVTIVGGIWIGLNVLLNQAKRNWSIFAGATAALVLGGFFALLRGNLGVYPLLADQDPIALFSGTGFLGHVEWPILGLLIGGIGLYVVTTLRPGPARIAAGAVVGLIAGYMVGSNLKPWVQPQLEWGEIVLFTLIGAGLGAATRFRSRTWIPGIMLGAAAGWAWATWFTSAAGGPQSDAQIAAIVPFVLLGARLGWGANPDLPSVARLDSRGRAFVFLGPALLFLSAGLAIPAIITMLLSLKDRDGVEWVGLDNYEEFFRDEDSIDVSNWSNLFTSQLFWIALLLLAGGVIIGYSAGRRRHGEATFERTGSSVATLALAGMIFVFAAFSVIRGTLANNIWWVITVTTISTAAGLLIAVLSERAGRLESTAKAMIFMPMAVSFVGASIVWRLQYQPRDPTKSQTGVLNALWVRLGELSHSGWPRVLALVVLGAIVAWALWRAIPKARAREPFAAYVAAVIVFAHLFIELARRSLGGFRFGPDGEVLPETILFLQNPPFNNVFLMIILIWIQTGFAMVILSAAIKAVPQEFIEAARVDGATETQTFFNVTLPQILPTVGVVVTTLIVLVTKVFDIVKVTTGGNFDTNVLANDMFTESFQFFNRGLGSAIAVFILISVLPVMVMNVRRMQRERALR